MACWSAFGPPDALTPVGPECGSPTDLSLEDWDQITDALITLHWLRVPERIQYKLVSWRTTFSMMMHRVTWDR